ncbi:hypothetical protein V5O48_000426 [Marasmius crinis-equi]|uniref:Uncharacterized protein n=1 Tax=Marasmius crinis-equi TaxID=585013 RepID=A0ABR3G1J4_9AGAR
MQLDPKKTLSSPLKRPPSDQTEYSTAAKYARAEHNSQAGPSSRFQASSPSWAPMHSSHHPSSSRNQRDSRSTRGSGMSHRTGFGMRPQQTGRGGGGGGKGKGKGKAPQREALPEFEGPLRNQEYIEATYESIKPQIKPTYLSEPKSSANNAAFKLTDRPTDVKIEKGRVAGVSGPIWRATATIKTEPPIVVEADGTNQKQAGFLAFQTMVYKLQELGLLNASKPSIQTKLSDGTVLEYDKAKDFMAYYCRRFKFGQPEITCQETRRGWEAVMNVQDRKIGMGSGTNKKTAEKQCYIDTVRYLEECDPDLWQAFIKNESAPNKMRLFFSLSRETNHSIRDLVVDLRNSTLYRSRPSSTSVPATSVVSDRYNRSVNTSPLTLARKSEELSERRKDYLKNPATERMRNTRAALPVYSRSEQILSSIEENDVTILMAATGSGKTTQVPQIILDSYIDKEIGARCNILCTQPRRLAALSVADRVSKERNESLGQSIGYEVRFEGKPPQDHGSVNFCTTGVFLKKLQSGLAGNDSLDHVTHVVVDEVHERDVDTDLLLVVLKRLLADRKARNLPLKVILMSATIDPTLFQNYFLDDNGQPAKVIDVPGRAFPVERHFLEDFLPAVAESQEKWVLQDESVIKYLAKELDPSQLPQSIAPRVGMEKNKNPDAEPDEDSDLPYPLIAATISHVLRKSDSGHVLTFLPGWDDMTSVQKILLGQKGPLGFNFGDTKKFSIHLLHSSIPLAEQQVIFEPPPEGVRRIILSTNIAETSVTIPDVVYVVDTGRLKEQRYDPQKHMSSLVSAWVGTSNLNQRAGRAGRHRPGEYFGVLSRAHADKLQVNQTVEMSRVDLSNVVMHVKALNFPGMSVEEVLESAIEPPPPERVVVAVQNLQMLGALDSKKGLTSLGRLLLQIPVDVQVGRLLIYGSFFRCLDDALSLAAILTNREPFLAPMHLREEARAKKYAFTPAGVASDPLTTLNAFKKWNEMQSVGHYNAANQFCIENFLSKPTLLLISKLRHQLLGSLYKSGVIRVSGGGDLEIGDRFKTPFELNENGDSMPLLSALIASALQPKFAVRATERILRTPTDKGVMMHPSSVNHSNNKHGDVGKDMIPREIFAFSEKRQNVSSGNANASTFLVNTTRLEPLMYMLFGAHNVEDDEQGLLCDHWINITGNLDALDDVRELKRLIDGCMLRVFEGILMTKRHNRDSLGVASREAESEFDDFDTERNVALSPKEMKELDLLSRDLVNILDMYAEDRRQSQSRFPSRPQTPSGGGPGGLRSLYPASGYSTPNGMRSQFNSRASTPVGRFRDTLAIMATSMRGLTQASFIADIRGARVRELEEKRINKEMANIRKKFKDGNLDGYQKKKYVAKIIFTYILGYKVDVGHMEAVNLISSPKYSEKQIGYLAVTLLMHENSDFLRLVVNSIRKDLHGNNEIDNCLALHAIANVGGSEMAEALAEDVHRLLISPTSQSFVKKKAALTLLRLYRKHPEVIPAAEWALRIVSIMDDEDLGVVVSVTSLIMALAQDHLDAFAVCYTKAVDRLHRLVIEHEYAATYAYYKVPSPWLQVKLLRLLQYYAPSEDPTIRSVLHQVLQTIMNNSAEPSRNVQHNNAQHAVLFEAIGLAIHLDTNSPLVGTAAVLLARFISSKETNVRYLGLDTMAHLAGRAESLEPIKKHQNTIILSLRDKDISVRRRALDLLYSMCDIDNSELIVGELLRYLKVADYALREEMVLKIAILTEKYATSYKWYVDTILQLISAAGDHVGEEVWYRVVQIVTNTDDLQEYAAKVVFEHLKAPVAHESMVKVGGYILGEYGHLIANEAGYSPMEQFQVLHSKSQYCVAATRSLLLSTYIKWVNVFPEIKPQLVTIFERYRHVLDADLQQRACEFYALASRPEDDEILQNVCEEMPPFPPRVSALLGRLNQKHGDTEDKRTWVHGGKDANLERKLTISKPSTAEANGAAASPTSATPDTSILGSLAGLDLSSKSEPHGPAGAPPIATGPNIARWFDKLTYSADGILYEDAQLQIGVKSRYQGHIGQLAIYLGNKVPTPLTSFTTAVSVSDPDALSLTFAKLPPNIIHSRTQVQQLLHVECKKPFTNPPVLTISYLAGSHQAISLRLPVVLTKFFEHVKLGQADFFERWRLIGGPPRESQMVFPITLNKAADLDVTKNKEVVSGHKLSVLSDIDPNPNNIVAAGVLHMSTEGKVGCLMRLEPNKEAKVCKGFTCVAA